MNLAKYVFNLTSVFIKIYSPILFLLILFPFYNYYQEPFAPADFPVINKIQSSIGMFCLLCWIYAIGYKSKTKLETVGVSFIEITFFYLTILMAAISFSVLRVILPVQNTHNYLSQIVSSEHIYLSVIFCSSLLIAMMITAKALVSAEMSKDALFKDYFTTFLLLIFPMIGLWFIQPRVKKL